MGVAEEIRQCYLDFRKDHRSPKRVILGEAKRRELLQEWSGSTSVIAGYMYPWSHPSGKKERFMGLEILVDMGDQDRLEIE